MSVTGRERVKMVNKYINLNFLLHFLHFQDDFSLKYKPVIGDLTNATRDLFKQISSYNQTLLGMVKLYF